VSDTRRDYRLLVAEHAVQLLEQIVRAKRLPAPLDWHRAGELVREARGLVKRLRFSFIPPTMLARSEDALRLRDAARGIARVLLDKRWLDEMRSNPRARRPLAEAKYAIRVLYGLPARLALGDENDPLYAVDIECVTVSSVEKHPQAKNLYVTHARGRLGYTIVTNLQDVRRGDLRAAAILPPAEFIGVISEAMYCSRSLRGVEDCEPGKRPPAMLVEKGEVARVVGEIASRIH